MARNGTDEQDSATVTAVDRVSGSPAADTPVRRLTRGRHAADGCAATRTTDRAARWRVRARGGESGSALARGGPRPTPGATGTTSGAARGSTSGHRSRRRRTAGGARRRLFPATAGTARHDRSGPALLRQPGTLGYTLAVAARRSSHWRTGRHAGNAKRCTAGLGQWLVFSRLVDAAARRARADRDPDHDQADSTNSSALASGSRQNSARRPERLRL